MQLKYNKNSFSNIIKSKIKLQQKVQQIISIYLIYFYIVHMCKNSGSFTTHKGSKKCIGNIDYKTKIQVLENYSLPILEFIT